MADDNLSRLDGCKWLTDWLTDRRSDCLLRLAGWTIGDWQSLAVTYFSCLTDWDQVYNHSSEWWDDKLLIDQNDMNTKTFLASGFFSQWKRPCSSSIFLWLCHTLSASSWSVCSLSISFSTSSDFCLSCGSRATSSTCMLSTRSFVSRSFFKPFFTRSRAPINCLENKWLTHITAFIIIIATAHATNWKSWTALTEEYLILLQDEKL